MEIAIYPSLTGMLFGAVLGSLLGTIAHTNNFAGVLHTILPQLAVNVKNLPDLNTLITTLLVNIILGFIAAVILMRRKNVESFITIEDFWGGILIGFVVGYSGFTAVQKLLGITTTSTQTAGLDVYFWH